MKIDVDDDYTFLGVLWRLDKVISGSPQALNKFRDLGKRVFYITNNNIKPREYYVEKARKLGFLAEEDEILSTAYLTAEYLKGIGFNKTAYVVGSEGLAMELDRVGIKNVGIGVSIIKRKIDNISQAPQIVFALELEKSNISIKIDHDVIIWCRENYNYRLTVEMFIFKLLKLIKTILAR